MKKRINWKLVRTLMRNEVSGYYIATREENEILQDAFERAPDRYLRKERYEKKRAEDL